MIGLVQGNALRIPLADGTVQCCVTSPPYYGLRDYQVAGQLGLEATPDEYVAAMVAVFREVRRTLRDDGVLWLVIGDSYAGSGKGGQSEEKRSDNWQPVYGNKGMTYGLKPKDLIGIPWRVAFALQGDGWYLRSDVIWHKPNPMPESVTDRPTKSHEYVFLLTKSARYYWDAEAVKEKSSGLTGGRFGAGGPDVGRLRHDAENPRSPDNGTRNIRTVWSIPTAPYKGAHFATYPPALVEPCIKAGTSERGACPECGAPWVRVVERTQIGERDDTGRTHGLDNQRRTSPGAPPERGWEAERNTIGWQPTCDCYGTEPLPPLPRQERDETDDAYEQRVAPIRERRAELLALYDTMPTVPCVVLDPFAGSGTTLLVARNLGRDAVGLDLSYAYLHDQARTRLGLDALSQWQNGKQSDDTDLDELPLFASPS